MIAVISKFFPLLSFPRRRESITQQLQYCKMDSRLRGNDKSGLVTLNYQMAEVQNK
jgi:hypothetical protein